MRPRCLQFDLMLLHWFESAGLGHCRDDEEQRPDFGRGSARGRLFNDGRWSKLLEVIKSAKSTDRRASVSERLSGRPANWRGEYGRWKWRDKVAVKPGNSVRQPSNVRQSLSRFPRQSFQNAPRIIDASPPRPAAGILQRRP